jgi:hypothetical protein
MPKKYQPELGQAIFGQPQQELECPDYLVALLRELSTQLDIMQNNNGNKVWNNPFENTGGEFKNSTFEAIAYDWSFEATQKYNFKWKDLKVSWYKYLGRGTSTNKEVTPDEAVKMFDECSKSIKEMDTTRE